MDGIEYPKKRDLDGVYFRVQRDGEWTNRCFTDLTKAEQERFTENRPTTWLLGLVEHLADCIRDIGDQFDIVYKEAEDECRS